MPGRYIRRQTFAEQEPPGRSPDRQLESAPGCSLPSAKAGQTILPVFLNRPAWRHFGGHRRRPPAPIHSAVGNHLPTDNLTAVGVDDDWQVQVAFLCRHVGDVCHPELVRIFPKGCLNTGKEPKGLCGRGLLVSLISLSPSPLRPRGVEWIKQVKVFPLNRPPHSEMNQMSISLLSLLLPGGLLLSVDLFQQHRSPTHFSSILRGSGTL